MKCRTLRACVCTVSIFRLFPSVHLSAFWLSERLCKCLDELKQLQDIIGSSFLTEIWIFTRACSLVRSIFCVYNHLVHTDFKGFTLIAADTSSGTKVKVIQVKKTKKQNTAQPGRKQFSACNAPFNTFAVYFCSVILFQQQSDRSAFVGKTFPLTVSSSAAWWMLFGMLFPAVFG